MGILALTIAHDGNDQRRLGQQYTSIVFVFIYLFGII
jgi:hypothetical protein